MNVEMLHYFRYVARYKNVTTAAQHLYISQPTLSRQIKALEEELGVKLFERNNKQMRLTEAGRAFYSDSEGFIKHMQTVIKNVQAAGDGKVGTLRLTLPFVMHEVLRQPLALMRQRYPGVSISLEAYNFDEVPSAVRHGLYDAGITYDFLLSGEERGVQDEVGMLPVRSEGFHLLFPAAYKGGSNKESIRKVVGGLPLILPAHGEPPFMNAMLSELQSCAQAKIVRGHSVNTTNSVFMNVAMGLGYSVVPGSWADYFAGREEIAYIDLTATTRLSCSVVLLYNKTSLTKTTEIFIDLLKEMMPQAEAPAG